ncbi:LOW QUALITY PROTEIN: hypothetical protein PHMEG_00027460 [Phytophthora megakarya]|uniref:Uncharacterized protein n=1 Tax=Phytophthora megakarya TaxID=4795 RepID=A0A225V760_9STRA|nr:LOW QUALITY PROTEIN: hypothetical protein PHMEG_00027460 [Phytophthora megakarya]
MVLLNALIGDNRSTNKATANLLGMNLFGWSCHKLNLAIGRLIESQPGLAKAFDSVANLASKANTLKSAAALRELTELVAVCRNDTRWSSSYKMIFRDEMELRQLPELEMPRQSDLQLLREFTPMFAKLDSDMIGLQKQGLPIASARGTLNEILEDFPELSHYLAQDAGIVHNPTFETVGRTPGSPTKNCRSRKNRSESFDASYHSFCFVRTMTRRDGGGSQSLRPRRKRKKVADRNVAAYKWAVSILGEEKVKQIRQG